MRWNFSSRGVVSLGEEKKRTPAPTADKLSFLKKESLRLLDLKELFLSADCSCKRSGKTAVVSAFPGHCTMIFFLTKVNKGAE